MAGSAHRGSRSGLEEHRDLDDIVQDARPAASENPGGELEHVGALRRIDIIRHFAGVTRSNAGDAAGHDQAADPRGGGNRVVAMTEYPSNSKLRRARHRAASCSVNDRALIGLAESAWFKRVIRSYPAEFLASELLQGGINPGAVHRPPGDDVVQDFAARHRRSAVAALQTSATLSGRTELRAARRRHQQ